MAAVTKVINSVRHDSEDDEQRKRHIHIKLAIAEMRSVQCSRFVKYLTFSNVPGFAPSRNNMAEYTYANCVLPPASSLCKAGSTEESTQCDEVTSLKWDAASRDQPLIHDKSV